MIAAKEQLALCQDTGVAYIFAWKDSSIHIPCVRLNTQPYLSVYKKHIRKIIYGFLLIYRLLYLKKKNPAPDLPAPIEIFATEPQQTAYDEKACPSYRFLFCAKSGGSSNKTNVTCATKALLTASAVETFLRTQNAALGTSACPPYTIAVVIGSLRTC